jgi:hypothetical protein
VDILLDYGSHMDMVEIKSSQTLAKDLFKGLIYYKNIYTQTRNCYLIYGGDIAGVQNGIQAVPWDRMASMEVE